jgi:predicted nuclease of predicted toxin-antitoxin system
LTLLLDECVDEPIARRLRDDGHVILSVSGMRPRASDDLVLSLAGAEGAVLVTSDKDFGELVFRERRATGGVLLLRLADVSPRLAADIASAALRDHGHEIPGAFTVVTPGRVRISPHP